MNENRKWIIRIVAITTVLIALGMKLGFVLIPKLNIYKFWMVIVSFFMLLFTLFK